jgi:putative membrane protein
MGPWHWVNGMGWWMVFGALLWIAVWASAIYLVVWLVRGGGGRGGEERGGDPVEIARRRYARGEISREEFEQIRSDLTAPSVIDHSRRHRTGGSGERENRGDRVALRE